MEWVNKSKTFLKKNRDYGTQFSAFPQNRMRMIEITRRLVLGLSKEKKKNLIIKAVTEWNGTWTPTKASIQIETQNLPIRDVEKEISILGRNLDMYVQLTIKQTIHYGSEEESQ